MAKIDLDGPRAARREAAGDPPMLTLDGKDYPLAFELPDSLMDEMANLPEIPEGQEPTPEQSAEIMSAVRKIVAAVLGPSWEELRPKLSHADLREIIDQLAPVYGFASAGESSASAASS